MPTPSGVNYLLQSLQFSLIPQLSNDKNQKWKFYVLCPYICCYVTIRSYALKGETLISLAKIVIISDIQNDNIKEIMLNLKLEQDFGCIMK